MTGNSMHFVVANNSGGRPCWWLYGANNKLVAWSGESFASMPNAHRAAAAFKAGAATARYDIYRDAGNQWRWRAWRSSDKVASSGEAFSSESAARTAAANVRDHAGSAVLAALSAGSR